MVLLFFVLSMGAGGRGDDAEDVVGWVHIFFFFSFVPNLLLSPNGKKKENKSSGG
jgi:hypothetical protein